jgi:hypothetical protein
MAAPEPENTSRRLEPPVPREEARAPELKQQRTSRYAAALVAQSRPATDGLATRYLRETRGLGDLPLPAELLFHPAVWSPDTRSRHPALLVPAYDGEQLARVQAVLLDPATAGKAAVRSPKLTFGKGASHVPATFAAAPGPAEPWLAGWTLVTEGPEDAAVLHAVTGLRCDASLGAGSLGKPEYPAGTKLIIFGDNGETGRTKAAEAAEAHRARGNTVVVAFPPEGIGDANDLLRLVGPDGISARIRRALFPNETHLPAYYPPVTEAREDALFRLRGSIRSFFASAVRVVTARRELGRQRDEALAREPDATPQQKAAITRNIMRSVAADFGFNTAYVPRPERRLESGSQGDGKTTLALTEFARIDADIIGWKFAPTLAKAEEDLAQYRSLATERSAPAMVVRGRGAEDPLNPHQTMCLRHEVADRTAKLGLSPRLEICPTCPFKDECGTLCQEQTIEELELDGRALFIMSREYAFLPCPAPTADIVIADERMTVEAVTITRLRAESFTGDLVPYHGADLDRVIAMRRLIDRLRPALMSATPLEAIREAGISRAELRDLRRALDPVLDPGINGEMSDDEISRRLDQHDNPDRRQALAVVAAVLREFNMPRPTMNAGRFRKGHFEAATLRQIKGIMDTAVLLLDGTGDEDLNRKLVGGRLRHEVIRIERDADVIGTVGRRYSRQSINGEDGRGRPIRPEAAKQLRQEIGEIAGQFETPLVIASKDAEAALLAGGHLPAGTVTTHGGAARGRNEWEDRQTAIAVGQDSASIADFELIAGAFYATDPAPVVSMARVDDLPDDWPYRPWPYRATRMRRMRDGALYPVEVDVHPDPRVQRVVEQIREAEVIQCLDRVRPIFNRRTLVPMNNLVLDLTYDRVLRHRELVDGGDRIERAWERAEVLPGTPEDLVWAFPDLFRSVSTARRALRRMRENRGQIANRESIWGVTPVFYRRHGQRGPLARVWVGARHADPRAAVEALLGPLVAFPAVEAAVPAAEPPLLETAVRMQTVLVGGLRPEGVLFDVPAAEAARPPAVERQARVPPDG